MSERDNSTQSPLPQAEGPIGYVYDIDGPMPVFDKNPPSEQRWLVHADAPVAVYAAPQQHVVGYAYGPEMQSGKGGFHVSWEKTEHYNVPVFSIRADTKGKAA